MEIHVRDIVGATTDDVDETDVRGHQRAPQPIPNLAADSLDMAGPLLNGQSGAAFRVFMRIS